MRHVCDCSTRETCHSYAPFSCPTKYSNNGCAFIGSLFVLAILTSIVVFEMQLLVLGTGFAFLFLLPSFRIIGPVWRNAGLPVMWIVWSYRLIRRKNLNSFHQTCYFLLNILDLFFVFSAFQFVFINFRLQRVYLGQIRGKFKSSFSGFCSFPKFAYSVFNGLRVILVIYQSAVHGRNVLFVDKTCFNRLATLFTINMQCLMMFGR